MPHWALFWAPFCCRVASVRVSLSTSSAAPLVISAVPGILSLLCSFSHPTTKWAWRHVGEIPSHRPRVKLMPCSPSAIPKVGRAARAGTCWPWGGHLKPRARRLQQGSSTPQPRADREQGGCWTSGLLSLAECRCLLKCQGEKTEIKKIIIIN